MTPAEYRAVEHALGHPSKRVLAALLGVSERAVANWRAGETAQMDGPTERLLRLLARRPDLVAELAA